MKKLSLIALFLFLAAVPLHAGRHGAVIPLNFFGTEFTELLSDPVPSNTLPYATIRLNGNGMEWGDISLSDGTFTNWTAWDATVAKFTGKKIHYVIGNQDGGTPTPPSWVTTGNLTTEYAAWCDAALAHGGASLNYVTVWNEPDAATLITGQGDPVAVLITLAQTLYTKVQAYNTAHGTSIKVVGPTTSGTATGSAALTMFQNFFSRGGGAYVDIADFHAYVNGVAPQLIVNSIGNARSALVSSANAAKPLIISESGVSSVSTPNSDDRVQYLAKVLVLAASQGISQLSYFACNFANYNICNSDGSLNAQGQAFVVVNGWLQGASVTSSGFYDAPPAPFEVHGVALARGASYQALIIWTDDRSTPSFTTPVWAQHYITIDGVSHVPGATVTLGFSPIMFTSN